ncbi:Thiolase-like, subgroup, partial [Ostreococcus tauri]
GAAFDVLARADSDRPPTFESIKSHLGHSETAAGIVSIIQETNHTGDAHARPPTANVLDEMLEDVMGIMRKVVDDLEPQLAHLLVESAAAKMTLTRPSAAMKRKMTTPSRIERGESAPVTLHTSDIYAEAPSSHFVRDFGDY